VVYLPAVRRTLPALALALGAALALLAAGCGYTLVGYGRPAGEKPSVAISTPRNETYEPGVEYLVADAFRREFLRRGAFAVTDDTGIADLVLSGSVRSLRRRPLTFSSVELAVEYEVHLELQLQARRSDGTEIAIGEDALSESEVYLQSADVEATRKNRQEALRRLAFLLAGRVHDALYEVAEGTAP